MRRPASLGPGARAELEDAQVVVVGRVGRLQECGAAEPVRRHVDHPEAEHGGVELHAAIDVPDVQDRVVEPVNPHVNLLGV